MNGEGLPGLTSPTNLLCAGSTAPSAILLLQQAMMVYPIGFHFRFRSFGFGFCFCFTFCSCVLMKTKNREIKSENDSLVLKTETAYKQNLKPSKQKLNQNENCIPKNKTVKNKIQKV